MLTTDMLLRLDSPVRGLNAGFFVSPGHGRHPARTIDSSELILVKSGVLGISEEGRNYELKAGETLILVAGRRHAGTLDYAKELQFYWLHFKFQPGGGAMVELPQHAVLRRPERLVELFRRYLDDQEAGELAPERADAMVTLMLLETSLRVPEGAAPAKACDENLAAQAENLILARFHERALSASAVAKALKCNPDYLNRVFRRARGKTLTAAIQGLRVKRAAQLLLEGSVNIEEAALRSGFSDRAYMRRLFKRLKGMTPKEYRNLHLRMHINTR